MTRAEVEQAAPADLGGEIEALRSPDAKIRAAAAYAIERRGTAASAAVRALAELLGDSAVVDPNSYRKGEDWSGSHKDFTVGMQASLALLKIGEAGVEPLIGALSRPEAEARKNAALALGVTRDRRAVEPLIGLFKADPDTRVRAVSVRALGALRDRRAAAPLADALGGLDGELLETATLALGVIGDRSAAAALGEVLSGPARKGDAQARRNAARALGAIRDVSGAPQLVAALKDEDAEVRGQAALALGLLGDPGAARALRELLNDPDEEVRRNAAMALGVLGRRGDQRRSTR